MRRIRAGSTTVRPSRVVLHVGAPLVASTYVRDALARNRRRLTRHGVLHPSSHVGAEYWRRGRRVRVVLEADGFLYKMARSLVGTLVNVGLGRLAPEAVTRLLETRTRIPEVKTAPAQGLFLERVFYG